MLENTETLLPGTAEDAARGHPLGVVMVGRTEEDMSELALLLKTLGVKPVGQVFATPKRINPATYLGPGKLDEVKAMIEDTKAGAVIFDYELSPNQLRNVEKHVEKTALDRPGVIIEIFSRHARTNESKTQVALARMQYLLPRLAHFWTHFERQGGGGFGSRGMGEKQIEVDRRLVKKRIQVLTERLKSIEKERQVQRAGREDVLKVAFVGYTNAGKSTLLNALTHSSVLVEDKLFATLDASVRALDPHCHPPVVAIDTVGFISRLPPSLVASFRSTLEELHEADLLVHVVDGSSSQAREQLAVTEDVLKELGLEEKPRIVVLNKMDLVSVKQNWVKIISPGAIAVSALNPENVSHLREIIMARFRKDLETWDVMIPYEQSKLESQLFAFGSIETKRHLEKGTFYRVRIGEGWARKLGLEKYRL